MTNFLQFSARIKRAILLLVFDSLSCFAQAGHQFISFQAPDAGFEGTQAFSINSHGDIAGTYYTASGSKNGFIRHTNGSFVTFSVPNNEISTLVGINDSGAAAGALMLGGGYLRSPDGKIVTFTAPNADENTVYLTSLNASGTVCGSFGALEPFGEQDAFIRHPDGSYIEFNADGFAEAAAINASGVVVGTADSMEGGPADYEAFLRHSSGRFEYFQAPEATGIAGTTPTAVNDRGEVTGYYDYFSHGDSFRGFVRGAGGTITSFDGPDSEFGPPYSTLPAAINAVGAIVGTFSSYYEQPPSGFVRKPDGTFLVLNYPGANGTVPTSINASGLVTGYYRDFHGNYAGFLFVP